MSLQGKVVLITGASSGIGEACARLFAKKGAKLSLAARRIERLQKLADDLAKTGCECLVKQTDVTRAQDISAWVEESIKRFGRIDILINNAGVGCVGRIADVNMEYLRRVMEINYFGAISCIQEVVPQMRKQGGGHVINVSSIIGKRSVPDIGGYCATKFALNAISDAMRIELKENKIAVTTVCPGLTDTEFADHQIRPDRAPALRAKMKGQSPAHVAGAILRATRTRRREVHLTAGGIFLVVMERISPWLMDQMLGLRHLFAGMK